VLCFADVLLLHSEFADERGQYREGNVETLMETGFGCCACCVNS